MSKKKPTSRKTTTHRPMLPTASAINNIKAQFAQQQSNKIVATGTDYNPAKPAAEVSEEQLHEEAMKQQFYPFPVSGLICEWVSNPARPGIYVICVNLEPDNTKEPKPGFFATCRQPEVAQMLCDGVNFLFKAQKEMEKVGAPEQVAPQVFSPVVLGADEVTTVTEKRVSITLPNGGKVDSSAGPDVTSEQ